MDKFFAVSLRSQRLKRFAGICFVLTAFVGVSTPAYGDAIYSADLVATLTSPPAINNLYGFAPFVGTRDSSNTPGFGDHGAFGHASVQLEPPGLLAFATVFGFANGVPGTPAHAESYGRTQQKINMANLSGVILPRQNLAIDLMLNLDYRLGVFAELPGLDIARAGILVRINNAVVYQDELIAQPNATAALAFTINIPITLPPDSVTPTLFDITVYGSADSTRPPDPPPPDLPPPPNPIPEPTSLVLLSIGALSLLG